MVDEAKLGAFVQKAINDLGGALTAKVGAARGRGPASEKGRSDNFPGLSRLSPKVIIKPGSLIKLVAKSLGDTPLDIMTQGSTAADVARLSFRISDSATAFDDSFCSVFTPGPCVWRLIGGGTGAKLARRSTTSRSSRRSRPRRGSMAT